LGVVVYNGDAAQIPFVFKTSRCAAEGLQTLTDRLRVYAGLRGKGDGRQSVGNVVAAGNMETDTAACFSVSDPGKGGAGSLIIGDIRSRIIFAAPDAEGNGPAGKAVGNLFRILDGAIENQRAILPGICRKRM